MKSTTRKKAPSAKTTKKQRVLARIQKLEATLDRYAINRKKRETRLAALKAFLATLK